MSQRPPPRPPARPAASPRPSTAASRPVAGADRRAHQRYEIRLAAELWLPERPGTVTAVTRDLSRGGACLESAYALPEGKNVEVALYVVVDGVEEASLPPLRVSAEVQWVAQNDEGPLDARHVAGIRFAGLTDAQIAWLDRFLPAAG